MDVAPFDGADVGTRTDVASGNDAPDAAVGDSAESFDAPVSDTGAGADAGTTADVVDAMLPQPGAVGSPCTRNGDCDSGLCLANGHCTASCASTADCISGWTCGALPGVGMLCQCTVGPEICDGMDNDCNGLVDDSPRPLCGPAQACTAGSCQCLPGNTCNGSCVDYQTDPGHCGSCGFACPSGVTCTNGMCDCPAGSVPCGSVCAYLSSDANHCGSCGNVCPAGQSCVNAQCACPVSAPNYCGGQCVDVRSDARNCGSCGTVCPTGGSCVSGGCVCPGTSGMVCSGVCVDAANDRLHCGSCANRCVSTETCQGGVCTCPGVMGALCSGVCRDLASDAANCGACGTACATGATCSSGNCVCPGVQGTACGGVCHDLASDPSHCGTCATACATGASCNSGTCVCPVGMNVCGSRCVDRNTDPNNCGTCGNVCATGAMCIAGACVIPSPRPIAPLSTAHVTSQRPTFRVQLAPGTDGVRVQVCRDRACTQVEQAVDATGSTATPPTALTQGIHFWRAFGRVGATAGTVPGVVWEFEVGAISAGVSTSWGTYADVNGDGYADLVSSSPADGGYAAKVFVFLGGATGIATSPSTTLLDPGGADGTFGNSIASAGDVNGDGYSDVIVGAPGGGPAPDRVYLFAGSATGLSTTPLTSLGSPSGTPMGFGQAVSSAGDVDADGYGDVVIGQPRAQMSLGAALVYRGGPAGLAAMPGWTLSPGLPSPGYAGTVVSYAGDTNGDGFDDVLVGTRGNSTVPGNAFLYLSSSSGFNTPPTVLSGAGMVNDFFGVSVACAGDVNADGRADLVVGAPNMATYTGYAYVFLGTTAGVDAANPTVLIGPAGTSGQFGFAVSGAGDVNRDGYSDVVIGAPYAGNQRGQVYMFNGSATGIHNAVSSGVTGSTAGVNYGTVLTALGDVTRDGFADIAVSAPYTNAGGNVWVYPGSTSGVTFYSFTFLGSPSGAGAGFGTSLASLEPSYPTMLRVLRGG